MCSVLVGSCVRELLPPGQSPAGCCLPVHVALVWKCDPGPEVQTSSYAAASFDLPPPGNTHTHAHKGRWKWLKQKNIILKQQVYSMGFTLFWHVHLYCSLFPSSFTENLDWYSLEPAQTSTPYHSSVTISRSLYVHVVWSHWVIKFDYDLKKKQNYLSILRSMLLIQSQVCDKNSSNGKWRDHKNKDRRELELCSVVFVCECVCDDVLGVGAISVSRVLYLQA